MRIWKGSAGWVVAGLLMAALASAPAVIRAAGGHDHGDHDSGKMTHKMKKGAHDGKHGKGKSGKFVTKSGEVVDMHCYMSHEGKGKKHAKCAEQCVLNGAPMGLLTDDGTVYLLAEDHSKKKAYNQVKELAAKRAQITGKMFTRGGLTAIVVHKVKKL